MNIKKSIRIVIFVYLVFVAAAMGMGRNIQASEKGEVSVLAGGAVEYVPGEVIVTYRNNVQANSVSNMKRKHSLKSKGVFNSARSHLVELPKGLEVVEALELLKKDSNVEAVQPNYIYRIGSVHVEPFYGEPRNEELWGFNNRGQRIGGRTGVPGVDINLLEAWKATKGLQEVVVAVIDTGVDINHPDLKDVIWVNSGEISGNGKDDDGNGYVDDVHGWDFFNNNNSVYNIEDGDEHGTHVAGTIAAALNGSGISGAAPGVRIMPLKFLGPGGIGTTSDAVRAVEYAKSKGVKIMNMSWGSYAYDFALRNAIRDSGALIIAAAGNDGVNNDLKPIYPASFNLPNVISVAAVDNRGRLASFSNYGGYSVHVAAPGEAILSTVPRGNNVDYSNAYAFYHGTSMAAPHVSGAAALMFSKGIREPWEIKSRLINTAAPLSSLDGYVESGGIINVYEAMGGFAARLDLSNNGTVGIEDIALAAKSYNVLRGEEGWSYYYDINEDGVIDIFDIVLISKGIEQ
jgi:subtilisin family serine protease